jgi:hypothetical protein
MTIRCAFNARSASTKDAAVVVPGMPVARSISAGSPSSGSIIEPAVQP